jgi:hypothetical protein
MPDEAEGFSPETASTLYGDRDLQLAGRIDQIIGWAKVGRSSRYYTMTAENVDRMCDDIIGALRSLGDHGAGGQVTVSRDDLDLVLNVLDRLAGDEADNARDRLSAAVEAGQ